MRIFGKIYEEEGEVLGTRASEEQAKRIQEVYPEAEYDPLSHIIRIEKKENSMSAVSRSVQREPQIFP